MGGLTEVFYLSDYQDFCETYGGAASDPEFFENWLDQYCSSELTDESDGKDVIPKNTLVHIIKLTSEWPAVPVGIIWNKVLEKPLSCNGANMLVGTSYNDPAKWFVCNGFTVRSRKINGFWYQVAYKEKQVNSYLAVDEIQSYQAELQNLNENWIKNCR